MITPARLAYDEMTEDDLVALGADGEPLGDGSEPSSERRVHVAIYAARPDVGAIVHTHSVHATAWSFLGEPLDTGTEELEAAAGGAGAHGAHTRRRAPARSRPPPWRRSGTAARCCSAATASWESARPRRRR